jgi:hypothetical protein
MTENGDRRKTEGSEPETGNEKEFLPPLDFSSIVFPFYTQGLFKLGLMDEPGSGNKEENLVLAKRLIDLLDLLKEKTRGNLTPEEEKFLESCLVQLKTHYLEKAKFIKL